MDWEDYFWADSNVLRNRLGLRNAAELDYYEREIVAQRTREGAPRGRFDQRHLQAIHKHLFQDVYDWAGRLRRVDMNKGGLSFLPCSRLEMGLADIHRRLEAMDRLRGRDPGAFADGAGEIIGDLNHAHPFRDGNGRTQLEYLRQLAEQAGHVFDARRLDPGRWIAASIRSHEKADNVAMADEIAATLQPRL